ncbi:MAG: type II CRISPR-associated endonuclease Cas1 [Nitratireductor sp.]|nr:type II CRISPR-associated endonuclease Cas1 [Nitratireductor sp.]
MAWKGVHLTRPARLCIRESQLLVGQDEGDVTIALEDIAWLIVDDQRTSLTAGVLSACAGQGIAVLVSDKRHMPCSLALPHHIHHRTAAVANLQLSASVPLKKRLWQSIVRAKIANQARTLEYLARRDPPPLDKMVERVGSGDPENIEAQAARAYWSCLFDQFSRGNEADWRNAALNYGYAVIRGAIARALTASGFIPAIGLHHASITNAFNLADDLMEPFRPVADIVVASLFQDRSVDDQLSKEDRQALASLPLKEVEIGQSKMSVLHACEETAKSLVRALEGADVDLLNLPTALGHRGEIG